MKKNILFILVVILVLSLSSCLTDESSIGIDNVGNITVSGIADSYTETAYIGQVLNITPTVKTDYADNDMQYQWILLSSKTGSTTANGDTIAPVIIGTSKDLNYNVSISPGTYQIRFIAKSKTNGYTVYSVSSLKVLTNFSQGFYIMKETADHNTELDLLNSDGVMENNLFTQINGSPIQGKPQKLDIDYNMCYINPDDNEMESTNSITVTTQNKNICVSRSTDLKTMFDRSNLLFDKMTDDEIPYGIINNSLGYLFYYSSKGIRAIMAASSYSSPTSGKFGKLYAVCGGSKYITHDIGSYGGTIFWDEKAHSLFFTDYNAYLSEAQYEDGSGLDITQNLTDYDCLHIGYNYMNSSGTATVILQNNTTGDRYLYLTESSFGHTYLNNRYLIKPDTHMSRATAYSTNGLTAKYIYCVDGGKLYASIFDNSDLSESEIRLQGINSDETITYVSNPFWNGGGDTSFNNLIIGTQKDNQYKLYFYNMVGGVPEGAPIKVVSGTGNVKSVRYLNMMIDTSYWNFGQQIFNIND